MNVIEKFQKGEITGHLLYSRLAERCKGDNRKALMHIARDELKHYNIWKKYTKKDVEADAVKYWFYIIVSYVFGITFAIKMMERGEEADQEMYRKEIGRYKNAEKILNDEERHEKELIKMIREERLDYIGSVVLGLNDALVELTGALAGLSFALQNTKIVALAGLITGIAAALSMGASSYLAESASRNDNALKSALYTGTAYIITVVLLVVPFFVFLNYKIALLSTLAIVIGIIAVFTFFVSVVNELSFRRKFAEMAAISLGVTLVSFIVGLALRAYLNIDV